VAHATARAGTAEGPGPLPIGPIPPRLGAAFDALDRAGGPWALLRGETDLATDGGEVDLLVAPEAHAAIDRELGAIGFAPVPTHGRGSHRFFHGYDQDSDRWTKLDLVSRIEFGRFQQFSTDLARGCLDRRDSAVRPPRLDSDDAFWAFLLHALLDRSGPRSSDLARLRASAAGARPDGPAARAIEHLLPTGWTPSRAIDAAADPGDGGRLARLGRRLDRSWSLRHLPDVAARLTVNRVTRRLAPVRALVGPPGLSVALLGPDGAGKSTLAAGLDGAFPLPVRRIYLGLYGRGTTPGTKGAGGRFGLPGRLIWLWRRSIAAAWQRRRGRIVVFDRHVLDLAVAPPGGGRKARLRRSLLVRACPTPDLSVILDVPGEELFRRKGEHDPASLERQRARYADLAGRLRHAALIDASVDADTVRREVIAAVWTACGARHGA
jgi:thymidylate kinase